MHEQPICSIIIISWNRKCELEAALDSVFAQTLANKFEVIVVDNASTDGTIERLRQKYADNLNPEKGAARLRVFQYPRNMGASHARNAGILMARAPHLAFLDSDAVLLEPAAIERCLDYLKSHADIRAVSAPIWFDRERTQPFCFGGYITPEGHFHGRRSHSERKDPMFLSTCFAVWDKQLILELGGFDPWYFWGIEDMDLSLRAHFRARRGETRGATHFAIVDGADVHHNMSPTGRHYHFNDFTPKFRALERQRMYLVMAYGGVGEFVRVLLTSPLRLGRIQAEAWERKLSIAQCFLSLLFYPALRTVMAPFNRIQQRRNHLAGAPMPQEK